MNFKSLIIKTSEQKEFKFKPIKKLAKDKNLNIEYAVPDNEQYEKLEKIIRKKYPHICVSCSLQDEYETQKYYYIQLADIIDSDLDVMYLEQNNGEKISLREYIGLCNMIQPPFHLTTSQSWDNFLISNQDTIQMAQMCFNLCHDKTNNKLYYTIGIDIEEMVQMYLNLCNDKTNNKLYYNT